VLWFQSSSLFAERADYSFLQVSSIINPTHCLHQLFPFPTLLSTHSCVIEDTGTSCQHVHFSCTKSSFINQCLLRNILWFFCFSIFTVFTVLVFFWLRCPHCFVLFLCMHLTYIIKDTVITVTVAVIAIIAVQRLLGFTALLCYMIPFGGEWASLYQTALHYIVFVQSILCLSVTSISQDKNYSMYVPIQP